MPSAPEAGNTTETLAPKNVLDTPSTPAVEPVVVTFPSAGTYPVAVASDLEARVADLEARIAHFNGRSSQKI